LLWAFLLPGQDAVSESGFGQVPEVPEKPEDRILDQAGVLSVEQRARLRREIGEARDRQGIELYVALFSAVPTTSVAEYAARIKSSWARENERVVVLVYDRLQHSLTFAATAGMERVWTRTDLRAAFRRVTLQALAQVPDPNNLAHAGELVVNSAQLLARDQMLEAAARDWRPRRWGSGFAWILIPVVAGGGLLAALAAFLARRQARMLERRRRWTAFPRVEVAQRLGGKYSGGLHGSLGE
jgi:uncharacterized membrane protein YgcG